MLFVLCCVVLYCIVYCVVLYLCIVLYCSHMSAPTADGAAAVVLVSGRSMSGVANADENGVSLLRIQWGSLFIVNS